MKNLINGIHHVTALAGDPQRNLNFYAGILGLRLVKKTVNFDAPDIYHFYYGDELGSPGSILTFFPYEGIKKGRKGKGMMNLTSFSVAASSLDFWKDRFKKFKVPFQPEKEKFSGDKAIYFEDPDGLGLELTFTETDNRTGYARGDIPVENAVKGFNSVELWVENYGNTAEVLAILDYKLLLEKDDYLRFAPKNIPGNYVDIRVAPNELRGLGGGGTIHHLAFNTPNIETQNLVREKIENAGLQPTYVLDRQYFKSIYFREPEGILFEVATADPGFTIDEPQSSLGNSLKLPPQYESRRSSIEQNLKSVKLDLENFKY